ncbi:MAG: hypothetical protein R3F20_03090 [Planctomycetota bacterium]
MRESIGTRGGAAALVLAAAALLGAGCGKSPSGAESAGEPAISRRIVANELRAQAVFDRENPEIAPLASARPGEVAVLLFVTTDCPIANGYGPEIGRIRADCVSRGARFAAIHVDPELAIEDAWRHAKEFDLGESVFIDRRHLLVDALGIRVTPEAAVLVAEDRDHWRLDYRGRIDDLYVDFGQRRAEASTPDLRLAIDRALAGTKGELVLTRAIGCYVPELGDR